MKSLFLSRLQPVITGLFSITAAFTLAGGAPSENPSSSLDPATRQELDYAQELIDMGMPDYGDIVLNRIRAPEAELLLEIIRIKGDISQGKFDEVKAIIAAKPDQESQEVWAMKVKLADGYYAWDKYAEAQGVYQSLFQKYPEGPPERLNKFYSDSAYKYSQMLLLMGKEKAALTAYRNILKAKLIKSAERQVKGEMAELMLKLAQTAPAAERKQYMAEINKILDELLWVQDLWFGKAIVMKAHVRMMENDIDGARGLVDEYRAQLKAIDDLLKEMAETGEDLIKLSPMAECHYLLGVIMQEEAERLLGSGGDRDRILELLAGKELKSKTRSGKPKRETAALKHLSIVFLKYPFTRWAADAQVRAGKVEDILRREFGAEIKSNVTEEQLAKVRRAQFQEARLLFNQNQFVQAAESYINVLNLFPEGEESVAALSDLASCYIETGENLDADMVIGYLVERFSRNEELTSKAGDELIRIAEIYRDRGMADRREAVYGRYFTHFAGHPRAAATFFSFGEERFRNEEFRGALEYYAEIADKYTNSPLYLDALNKIAYCYSKTGDKVGEVKGLTGYVEALEKEDKPGHALINAKYRLASAYRQLGAKYVPSAFNRYSELVKLLKAKTSAYEKTPEEAENNRKIFEGAMFYKALCYSMLTKPEKKLRAYKMEAIKSFNELVEKFPKSLFASPALSQMGSLWTALNKPDEAQKVLRKLKKEYPDSKEAQNALLMLGNNLLTLGMKGQATRVFEEMFSGLGDYSDTQILTVGNEMEKIGEYEIALQAFNRVLESSKERTGREPATLGKGRVLVKQEKYEEGAGVLEDMLEQYPNSGYTVQACFSLSTAYGEIGKNEPDENKRFDFFNNAVKAMKRVRKFEKMSAGRAKSDVKVACIFELKAKAEEQFGMNEKAFQYRNDAIAAYETLILLGDFSDPGIRQHIEEAFHECIPLLLKIGKWDSVIEDCDKYQKLFPRGKYRLEVRKWRSQAKMKVMTEGGGDTE